MILFASLISILGLWATLLSFSNRRYMERLKKETPQVEDILVTIAIPARNEEANIVRCVSSLMQQSYKHIEILVLDDNSTDATAKLVEELALTDTRIHLLKGKPLQDGWRGKLYGMQQLFEESKGKYILYTDADTIHSPDSVQYGLNIIEHEHASMLSGYPKQTGNKKLVQILVSAMVFNTALYLPLRLQRKLQWPGFAMAIGQYMLLKRSALEEIGGFTSMPNVICDDVALARMCARTGHTQIFADMKQVVSCEMFKTFQAGFSGLERSVTGVIKQNPFMFLFILLVVVVLISCALAPLITIGLGIAALFESSLTVPFFLTLVGTFLLFSAWAFTAHYHGFPKYVAFSGPLTFVFVVLLYLHGYYLQVTGKGFIWKDRIIL